MLNIESEPMARPITKSRREKKLPGRAAALRRRASQRSAAGRTPRPPAPTGRSRDAARPSPPAAHASRRPATTMNVASRTKPIQSMAPVSPGLSPRAAPPASHARNSGPHEESVEPEDRAPAHDVGKRAAEKRPDTEAEHQEPGPGADRRRPTLRRRAGVDRGQGARHRERCREALQGPSGQQRGLCAGDGNDAGRDGEQRQPRPSTPARAPNRSAAWPPSTMQAAEATR